MEQLELRAEGRTVHGKKVKQLRAQELIPAVVYGPDTPARTIQAPERVLFKVLQDAGSTRLIYLFVNDESSPTAVLARDVTRDILSGHLLHVDFYQVRLTEKVKVTPRLEMVGESPIVKAGTAVLIHGMSEIEVECLPGDLIDTIPVDLSVLENLEDSILVSDLPVPEGVTILASPEEVVVSLVSTRASLMAEEEAEGAGAEEEPFEED